MLGLEDKPRDGLPAQSLIRGVSESISVLPSFIRGAGSAEKLALTFDALWISFRALRPRAVSLAAAASNSENRNLLQAFLTADLGRKKRLRLYLWLKAVPVVPRNESRKAIPQIHKSQEILSAKVRLPSV
jgi:hypothetical protein